MTEITVPRVFLKREKAPHITLYVLRVLRCLNLSREGREGRIEIVVFLRALRDYIIFYAGMYTT